MINNLIKEADEELSSETSEKELAECQELIYKLGYAPRPKDE